MLLLTPYSLTNSVLFLASPLSKALPEKAHTYCLQILYPSAPKPTPMAFAHISHATFLVKVTSGLCLPAKCNGIYPRQQPISCI